METRPILEPPKIDLTGKVMLVTGSGRGIGAAVARAALAAGANVVLHDIAPTTAVADLLGERYGDRSHFVTADLSSELDVCRLWDAAVRVYGSIDILVNNAGIYEEALIDGDFDAWRDSWERTLAINLLAPAHLCRAAVRHFRTRGGGRIINVSSRAGFRGDGPDYPNYAASKGALLALTRTIARGFAAENVLAYAVAPGFVRTDLNGPFFERFGEGVAIAETPLGEIAEPADIANVIVFLASDLARHCTGATIDVNGASYVR
ncbi:MAG TPA: SDR family oxidoreductase [Candidatus Elarobacter sp.]